MTDTLPKLEGDALFMRLQVLAARFEAGIATDDERAEWAELSVEAMTTTRAAKSADARRLAASYFAHLVANFGEEVTREAWGAAPPKRRPGYRVSEAKRRQDAIVMAADETYRDLGVEREDAAARALDNGKDPHDARRVIDRRRAKSRP